MGNLVESLVYNLVESWVYNLVESWVYNLVQSRSKGIGNMVVNLRIALSRAYIVNSKKGKKRGLF